MSECEYLSVAKGIPGVVEMLAYQELCAQTAKFRPPGFDPDEFRNRFKLRLALKRYGAPLWRFHSRLQLMYALRDALIGTWRRIKPLGMSSLFSQVTASSSSAGSFTGISLCLTSFWVTKEPRQAPEEY